MKSHLLIHIALITSELWNKSPPMQVVRLAGGQAAFYGGANADACMMAWNGYLLWSNGQQVFQDSTKIAQG